MSSTINKSDYPYLFGNISIYAILAQTGITTAGGTTTKIYDGSYGSTTGITGSYIGDLDNDNVR